MFENTAIFGTDGDNDNFPVDFEWGPSRRVRLEYHVSEDAIYRYNGQRWEELDVEETAELLTDDSFIRAMRRAQTR